MLSGVEGREFAERRLREGISSGDLAPGCRLVEGDLGMQYGVTRSAVRDAIDALIAEGLVERIPNRGARVRRFSAVEAIEITECRMVLEGLIAGKAAERITDGEAEHLRAHLEIMRKTVASEELLLYSPQIAQLHQLIRLAARQLTAATLIERLQAQIVRHQFRLSLRQGRARESLSELERLIEAIVERRAKDAEQAAKDHLKSVITALAESADR